MFSLQKPTTIPSLYKGCCWHGKRTVEVGQGKVLETAQENKVPSLPQALIPIWRVSARCLSENTWQLSTDEQSPSLPDLGTHSPLTPVSHRGTSTYQAELDSKVAKAFWAPLGWFCVLSYVWYLLPILKGRICCTTLCSSGSGLCTEECHHTLTSSK